MRLALAVFIVLAGCSSSELVYDSPEQAFDIGEMYYSAGKYTSAIRYYKGVFDYGRTHEWAADAQLKLARAHQHNRDYILAAEEYANFTRLYRADPRVGDAEFARAMTFYERAPRFELDQSATERGIEAFSVYMQRYPEHDSVDVATERIRLLREKLAAKVFYAGGLYERRGLYEAAAISYEAVFDTYPDTPFADDALLGAMRCYIEFSDRSVSQRQVERLQKALDHYQRLLQLFPSSPLLKTAEELYAQASEQMEALAAS